jgi:hypothetical protein
MAHGNAQTRDAIDAAGSNKIFSSGNSVRSGRRGSASKLAQVMFDFGTIVHLAAGAGHTIVINSLGE